MTKNDYTVVEFYAGAARLAKLATALGESCAAMDILYDLEGLNKRKHNAMDMNTNAGFVSLAFDLCFFPACCPWWPTVWQDLGHSGYPL